MADRAEKSRRDRREPHPLAVLAGVLAAFLLLAACYVGPEKGSKTSQTGQVIRHRTW